MNTTRGETGVTYGYGHFGGATVRGTYGIVLATVLIACGSMVSFGLAADPSVLYIAHCSSCHQPDGRGLREFAALARNETVLGDPQALAALILNGRGRMPPYRHVLDDEDIAAILSHIRRSFGNDAEPIEEELVSEVRAETADDAVDEREE